MKKTLFVALVATVALLATSCKKAEAPKAAFSWENDGLVVSFNNLSKNADSYKWEFGDGQTSTETSPKHTYAKNGEYTVVLTATGEGGTNAYTEAISLKTAAIKIDGKYEDWDAVIADKTAAYTALDRASYSYNTDAIEKFAAYLDGENLYFMLVCKSDKEEVMPLDMYFGVQGELEDESPCTHLWVPMYCDYLLEFGKGDTFEPDATKMDWYDWQYDTFFAFDHATGGWSFNQLAQNVCDLSEKELLDGGLMRVEGKVAVANFQLKSKNYIYISCNTSNSGWGESGAAPAAIDNEGTTEYQAQLKVVAAE